MSPVRFVFARWLFSVALALWLGGLLAIGAIVAPVTAHFMDAHPAFAADPARKAALLTAIVGGSLRVFNFVCYTCSGFLLWSQLLLLRMAPRRLAVGSLAVTLLLAASALVLGFVLFPLMDAAQASGQMNAFDALHKRYEAVSTDFQFPLLLVLALLAALRDASPAPPSAPSPTKKPGA